MSNNVGEQINQVIDNISSKLGVAAEKLYPALKHQSYIDGIQALIWLTVGLVGFIIILKYLIKWFKNPEREGNKHWSDGDITEMQIAKIAIGLVVEIAFIIIVAWNLDTALNSLLNPDWYAIQKIISQLK